MKWKIVPKPLTLKNNNDIPYRELIMTFEVYWCSHVDLGACTR